MLSLPIRVVGVGSPNGDDAVGWEVVRRLRSRRESSAAVEFVEVHGGQGILDILDGRGTLIVVDALVDGGPPGVLHRLDWPDPRLEALAPASTHMLRPAEALSLAGTLGVLPPCVIVLGISADSMQPGTGLTPTAHAAISAAAQQIEQICRDAEAERAVAR